MRNPRLTAKLQGFGTTIFAEMSALAVRTGAVNLGQGFPDTDGPTEIAEAAIAAIRDGRNQYPPGNGVPELRAAIADHQHRFYGIDVDPDGEVLVTAGATEAIAASILALCDVGDEVVMFEPYYDSYAAVTALAGATRRGVLLRAPGFTYDPAELDAAITPRTRVILLNSPHNPTGHLFGRAELEHIARLCVEHDLVAVTDEVYEHLVFEGDHVPLCTLPGMRDRTVTISSAGKTFSFTGWKVGWVTGTPQLVEAVTTAKQFLTYANAAPFQPAIARGLQLGDDYFTGFTADMRTKRDRLCAGLADVGFDVTPPDGTYFVTVDIRSLGERADSDGDGLAFCRSLPERVGVVAVPAVVFYDHVDEGRPIVRFAFCKRLDVLDEAVARLKGLTTP